jgi:hypothetical protein
VSDTVYTVFVYCQSGNGGLSWAAGCLRLDYSFLALARARPTIIKRERERGSNSFDDPAIVLTISGKVPLAIYNLIPKDRNKYEIGKSVSDLVFGSYYLP